MLEERIPARYIGIHEVLLKGGKPLDGDGNPRKTNVLLPGETIMMPADEALGMSYLRERDTLTYLGAGYVVLPDHQTKTPEELAELGYEFSEGRSDFEPVIPEHQAARVPRTEPKPLGARDPKQRRLIVVPVQAPVSTPEPAPEQNEDQATTSTEPPVAASPISSTPSEMPIIVVPAQQTPTEGGE